MNSKKNKYDEPVSVLRQHNSPFPYYSSVHLVPGSIVDINDKTSRPATRLFDIKDVPWFYNQRKYAKIMSYDLQDDESVFIEVGLINQADKWVFVLHSDIVHIATDIIMEFGLLRNHGAYCYVKTIRSEEYADNTSPHPFVVTFVLQYIFPTHFNFNNGNNSN